MGIFGPGIFSMGRGGGCLFEALGIFRVLVYAPFDHLRHLKSEVHVPLPGPSSHMKNLHDHRRSSFEFPKGILNQSHYE